MRLRSALGRAFVLAVVVLALTPAPAFAKGYFISRLAIGAAVSSSGSMEVTERREVDFSGNFSWAQWALNKKGGTGIEVLGVDGPDGPMRLVGDTGEKPPPGTYVVLDEPGRVVVKVGFSANDEVVPFTVRYRVGGAAKRYKDTAELYWQFVGNETDVRSENVSVRITLPESGGKPVPKADVRAWAHGPLTGVVEPVEGGATLQVALLPPNTFVEARLLFPAAALAAAPVIDQPREQAVLAEEARFAEEANAQRRAAQERLAAEERMRAVLVPLVAALGILVPLAVFGIVLWLWLRYGRDYKATFTGYLREVPEGISVPLAGALWADGDPADATVGATLMDLALQGAVVMRPVTQRDEGFLGLGAHDETTYELALDREKLAGVGPLEQDLARFFFDDTMSSGSFTIRDLRAQAKEHPRDFTEGLSGWRAKVRAAAEDRGWFEKAGLVSQVGAALLTVLAGAVVVGVLIFTRLPWLALGLLPVAAAIVPTVFMRRRSPDATELFARYAGLRDYLRDFSQLDEAPPMHVILWEKFLVMAVVFGIAEQVIAQMQVKVPQVVSDPAFATAYWWTYSGAGYASPVSAVTAGVSDAVSVANSAMSSAGGGGGGFSGGGGGGGGGGGFSAG